MKIKVRDIPTDGLDISKVIPASEIGLTDEDCVCLTPLTIYAHVEKASDAVIATAEVKAKYRFDCARCLETIEADRDNEFQMVFEVDPTVEFVDLGDDIRQELLIAVTQVTLCSEDCRGLCMGCGANLNREKCFCKKD